MKRLFLTLSLITLLCTLSSAQQKIKDVFLQMPDSLLPYLSTNSRLDFIDFMESGMKAGVQNELGGKSEMLSLTDDKIDLQVSNALQMTMRLMPVKEAVDSCSQVICVIKTYGKEAPESRIEVYSVKWHSLDVADYLTLPHDSYVAVWMDEPSLGVTLTQTNQLDFLAHEEQEKTKPWLKNIEWKP